MADIANWRMRGDWFDVCSCNIACPCEFAQPPTNNHCEGVMAYHIREGAYGDVRLDALSIIAVLWFDGNFWTKTNQKSLKFRKSTELGDAVDRVAEDGEHPARDSVAIDEGGAVDAIMPGPGDGEVGLSLLDMDRLGLAIASQASG